LLPQWAVPIQSRSQSSDARRRRCLLAEGRMGGFAGTVHASPLRMDGARGLFVAMHQSDASKGPQANTIARNGGGRNRPSGAAAARSAKTLRPLRFGNRLAATIGHRQFTGKSDHHHSLATEHGTIARVRREAAASGDVDSGGWIMRMGQSPSISLGARRARWNVFAIYLAALGFGILFWIWVGRAAFGLIALSSTGGV
jgi:hypothetical protein